MGRLSHRIARSSEERKGEGGIEKSHFFFPHCTVLIRSIAIFNLATETFPHFRVSILLSLSLSHRAVPPHVVHPALQHGLPAQLRRHVRRQAVVKHRIGRGRRRGLRRRLPVRPVLLLLLRRRGRGGAPPAAEGPPEIVVVVAVAVEVVGRQGDPGRQRELVAPVVT